MSKQKLDYKKYTKKEAKDFNFFTRAYQLYSLWVVFKPFVFWPFYNFKFIGDRNKLKGTRIIVAPNHVSYLDPHIVAWSIRRKCAYMAKKELFEESLYMARNISRLGGFAVNREKLEVSTIKTAKEVFKANWDLCIFPQGGIRKNKKIENINRGFIAIAKMMKVPILPLSISGLEQYNWNPFNRKPVEISIGEPISYELSEEEIINNWANQISSMAKYELGEI